MQAKTEVETATVGAFAAVQKFLSEKIRWADNILKLVDNEKFGDSEAEAKREFETFIRDSRLMGVIIECYEIANHFGLDLGVCKSCYEDRGDLVNTHKAHANNLTAHVPKTLNELSGFLDNEIQASDATIFKLQEMLDELDEDSDEWSEGVMEIENVTGSGAFDYQVLKLLNIKVDMCTHCMEHMDEVWEEIIHPPKKEKKSGKKDGKSDDELPMAYR